GWIDGQRKGLGEVDYAIRFTPRKPGSIWSVANVKRVEALRAQRRMQPAGLEAFEARAKDRSGIYSYEQRKVAELDETQLRKFQGNRKAWEFFQAQPPSYRKSDGWWVINARAETKKLKGCRQKIANWQRGRSDTPLRWR